MKRKMLVVVLSCILVLSLSAISFAESNQSWDASNGGTWYLVKKTDQSQINTTVQQVIYLDLNKSSQIFDIIEDKELINFMQKNGEQKRLTSNDINVFSNKLSRNVNDLSWLVGMPKACLIECSPYSGNETVYNRIKNTKTGKLSITYFTMRNCWVPPYYENHVSINAWDSDIIINPKGHLGEFKQGVYDVQALPLR